MGNPTKKIKLNEELIADKDWDYENKPWEICLHSYKYIFEGKEYKSKFPYWHAKEAISKL